MSEDRIGEEIEQVAHDQQLSPRDKAVDLLMSRDNPQVAVEKGEVTPQEALRWLEQQGSYVFHGTAFTIDGPLEPRQAFSYGKPDGPPGVAASKRADVSIFRSIINRVRDEAAGYKHHSSWSGEGDAITFRSWPDQIRRARDEKQIGYVYVFNADGFHDYSGSEVRSEIPVEPVYCIPVSVEDLPDGIEEIEQGT